MARSRATDWELTADPNPVTLYRDSQTERPAPHYLERDRPTAADIHPILSAQHSILAPPSEQLPQRRAMQEIQPETYQ